MNKGILLINPPMTYLESMEPIRLAQPMGISYIAAVLENSGYDVKLLDAHAEGYNNRVRIGERTQVGLNEDQIKEQILKFNPTIVGISAMFMDQYKNTHMVCRAAKIAIPEIIVVVGGVYPTMIPEDVLKDANVDYIIKGEAEHSFTYFCDWKINGDQSAKNKIDGLNLHPKEQWIKNLDDLPFPARHLLDLQKYSSAGRAYREPSTREPALPIITSRCCPAACNLCATHIMQGYYRERSVGDVIEEIEFLINTYDMKEIYFLDDALAYGNFREILKMIIKNRYDLVWHGANGVATYSLDDELIDLFAKSGCYKIILSIESGNQETLRYMKKPVRLDAVRSLIEKIRSHNMRVESMFMLGLPNETRSDILQTIQFAESLNLDYVSFPIATPFKGTDLYENCLKKNYLVKDYKLENLKFGIGNIQKDDWGPEFVETVREESWKRINKINNHN